MGPWILTGLWRVMEWMLSGGWGNLISFCLGRWFDLIYDASITAPYCTSQSDIPEGQEHLSTDCGVNLSRAFWFEAVPA